MKQQIITFFAIVAILQFCSITANPVETPKLHENESQDERLNTPSKPPHVNMAKVQAVKLLCDALINNSNAQQAAQQHKPDANKGSEHSETESHTLPPHQHHETPLVHAENENAEHKNEEHEEKHRQSGSENTNPEQHENQQEHHESDGANQEEHTDHHHKEHHENQEGQTETQHAQ